jgi:hypothetical protein
MSSIILPGKCGWLYILRQRQSNHWGFGKHIKNANIKNYLIKNYIMPSVNKTQEFDYLYYGRASEISALEDYLKNEMGDQLEILFEKRLEWFRPDTNVDGEQIVNIVEERCKVSYPEIFRIKRQFLPFSPTNIFSDIKEKPNTYLEMII